MNHNMEFQEGISDIREMVERQKHIDFWSYEARKLCEEVENTSDNFQKRELYLRQLGHVNQTLHELKKTTPEYQSLVAQLRHVISAFMEVQNMTLAEVAKRAHVEEDVVKNCLRNGFKNDGVKGIRFGLWAIKEFQLDANRYLRFFL
ncbi:hypothetical protein ACFVS2_20755 [Brevibacillus sp. NPDC058079]|uniref:hypothetical protein n=1 Tax=Brevibacillus sp. NPDC058079 TaxID=3346330 RepID=UPI0036E72CB3